MALPKYLADKISEIPDSKIRETWPLKEPKLESSKLVPAKPFVEIIQENDAMKMYLQCYDSLLNFIKKFKSYWRMHKILQIINGQ